MKRASLRTALQGIVLMMILGLYSCSKDGMDGREYIGYYHSDWFSLEFDKDSEVVGTISSTDFVGHFSDRIYGHYEYKHPYITITWEKVAPDNDIYINVIPNPDSIIVSESLDMIKLYERNKDYILPKSRLYDIDSNAPFLVQIGQYFYLSILLVIALIVKNFIYIVIALAILPLVLVVKWRKSSRKKSLNLRQTRKSPAEFRAG